MSERKVLNKYYPPDYDPRRLPRKAGGGNIEDKIMVIRTMAPFHMRCITCGNYIYRGTKFNSRVETIKGERYLGTIPIRRFYIRCTKCGSSITFKTDPENQDYAMETGATRNFEANRMWQLMEKREDDAIAEEERLNPMKALENRTQKSNQQMVTQENLEELFELAEMTGDGTQARLTALKKITDARELERKVRDLLLEKGVEIVIDEQKDLLENIGRMDGKDEDQEVEDQVEVKAILKTLKPTDLLTLNFDEEESYVQNYALEKKQRKLREATDTEGTKKKFSTLVKLGKKDAVSKAGSGISYKDYKEKLRLVEAIKKNEERKKKQTEERLATMFADYGSSSSSSDDEEDSIEVPDNIKMAVFEGPQEFEFTIPEKIPDVRPFVQLPVHSCEEEVIESVDTVDEESIVEQTEEHQENDLPAGFFDKSSEQEKPENTEDSKKRKVPATFGTDDFWSSMTKKKN